MRTSLAVGLLWGLTQASAAQTLDTSSVGTARLLQGNYAVPDAPALKMIDAGASMLLRPVSVRALTGALSSATDDASFIPRAFAVEFAPFMLPNGERMSLVQYRKNAFWNRARVSVATKRDTGAAARSQMALALRLSFEDKSDLRMNPEVYKTLLALTGWMLDSAEAVKSRWALAGLRRTGPRQGEPDGRYRAIEREVAQEQAEAGARLVEAAKAAQEDARWNADVFDVAVGLSASAADSTAGGTRADGVAGWVTKGWGLRRSIQLLIGGRGAYERDVFEPKMQGAGELAVRFYLGSNRYKALGEVQGSGRGAERPRWLAQLGGELQLSHALWIDASLGYEAIGADPGNLVSSFKAKFTPPSLP